MRPIGPAESARLDAGTEALDDVDPALLPLYLPLLRSPPAQSLVWAQVGQSLDGRIATPAGDAREVSGPGGIAHLHRLRALADAVIVGAGTVLHDDPRLTVRNVGGRSPARVVIDPSGRVPDTARVFNADGIRRIVVQAGDVRRPAGVETIRLPRSGDSIDPKQIVSALAGRGLYRILIEGGARTIRPFLAAGVLDRIQITLSPLIIGEGPAGLTLPAASYLRDCLRPRTYFYDLGGELVVDCDLAGCGGNPADGKASRS